MGRLSGEFWLFVQVMSMAGKDEGKDWATLSTANLTDHMLKINTDNTLMLLQEAKEIHYEEYDAQAFLLKIIPKLQKIVVLTTANVQTSHTLTRFFNQLVDEVLEPVDLFYPPLAQNLFKRVVQGINLALWGAGAMKETAFLKVIISALSRINVADEKIVIPESLIKQMDELDEK
jgi:hypothetical protein